MITWREANCEDIRPCLALQRNNRGDGFCDVKSAVNAWRALLQNRFSISVVIEAAPAIQRQRLIGFGAGVLVCREFADAEIAQPSPLIALRVLKSIEEGRSAVATRRILAGANAGQGVDVIILFNAYRDDILDEEAGYDVKMAFVNSLIKEIAGYRIFRILVETSNRPMEILHRASPEYRTIAEFPAIGHVIHLMNAESVTALPGSIANPLFKSKRPVLRLRESDQELLLATLDGSTDQQIAERLHIALSAVKARWRSTFDQVSTLMPELFPSCDLVGDGRGLQKRHNVIAYVRSHPEELRPYDWSQNAMKGLHKCLDRRRNVNTTYG